VNGDPVRVLLADDQQIVLAGLVRILAPRHGFEIVGECSDGIEVLGALQTVQADVIVMDLRMRGMDGVEATQRLQDLSNPPPVMVLTTFGDDESVAAALQAGARGFVLKEAPPEDIIRAVRVVAQGDSWVDPSVTGQVLATYREAVQSVAVDVNSLSSREVEVLRLVARGATNTEIAEQLFISGGTVKSHVSHILTKLGIRDRAAMIVFAYRSRMVA
jgi:DNA-binding NarL/FixJ family response regulator